jgi:UDP-N-acetylmuramoylalanine--D-glutamate ligase
MAAIGRTHMSRATTQAGESSGESRAAGTCAGARHGGDPLRGEKPRGAGNSQAHRSSSRQPHRSRGRQPQRAAGGRKRERGIGRTLVAGLGDTGLSVARYLAALGEPLLVVDSRASPPGLEALRAARPDIEIMLETLDARWLDGVARLVVSPGLGTAIPLVVEARRRGIEVVGDIELFARAAAAPVVAVTGSNGKSTVATLTARMLEAEGLRAPSGGNLGPPALDLLNGRAADAYVLEISSFQMETTESLRPVASALLNVSADHLDRHTSLAEYAELKRKLLSAAEIAVFNHDDLLVREMARGCTQPVPFSVREPLARGYSIIERGGRRFLARDGNALLAADALRIRGTHNEANALAALALTDLLLAHGLGRPKTGSEPLLGDDDATEPGAEKGALTPRGALAALASFEGLPHRCRVVAERRGVTYIDDSKGTNVGATMAAIEGLAGPLILIAGGLGKGADFAPLAAAARGKVEAVVLIGTAAPDIERAFAGVSTTRRAADMPAAVAAAAGLGRPGVTVLLSPACASQDMFKDYKHRGRVFADAVEALPR